MNSAPGESQVSEFHVPKMDCPSEERLIRMALEDVDPPAALQVDLPNRTVKVFHRDNISDIESRLIGLGLGATRVSTHQIGDDAFAHAFTDAERMDHREARILKWLLAINAIMFVLEMTVGWLAQSAGLIADSLDMFADAAVYGLALYAVGHSARMKLRAAHFAGWLQLALALFALSEVVRRYLFGSEPASTLMMIFGLIALCANVLCLVLIARSKDSGAHMKASWIFSANDVIANVGVIVAGFLVAWTGSRYPDLIIGLVIGFVVLNGARKILRLKG